MIFFILYLFSLFKVLFLYESFYKMELFSDFFHIYSHVEHPMFFVYTLMWNILFLQYHRSIRSQ